MRLLKKNFLLSITAILILLLIIVFPASAEIKTTHTDDGKILISNNINWIKFDPVSDIIAGQITVTGTTNLPAGSPITGQLYIATDLCRQKTCNVDMSLYGNLSTVIIQSGANSSNNTFSIPINTKNVISSTDYFFQIDSSIGSYGDIKIVIPELFKEQIQSSISASSHSSERYWIWINPLTDETATHVTIKDVPTHFQLTGSTNLPVGENIPYIIIPYNYFDVRFPDRNWTISLIRNQGYVIPGKKTGINSFSMEVDASQYCPGSYFVILWNPRFNSSDPNDFLASSTAFGFKENANLELDIQLSYYPNISSDNNSQWFSHNRIWANVSENDYSNPVIHNNSINHIRNIRSTGLFNLHLRVGKKL